MLTFTTRNAVEILDRIRAFTNPGGHERAEEGLDLLRAVNRMGRVPTAQEIYDWKCGRGGIALWPRTERERWLSWARRVISEFVK